MAAPFSSTNLRVPKGFQNLLGSLCREVLREKPQDVIKFAANHFEALLQFRQDKNEDITCKGADFEDLFYNSAAYKDTRGVSASSVVDKTVELSCDSKPAPMEVTKQSKLDENRKEGPSPEGQRQSNPVVILSADQSAEAREEVKSDLE